MQQTPQKLDELRRLAGEARRSQSYDQAIQLNRQRADGWRKRDNREEAVAALIEVSRDCQSSLQPLMAFASLNEARALLPKEASVLVALGDLYTELHLIDQAIPLYEAAGPPLATSRLMRAYLSKGNRERARFYLEQDRQRLRRESDLRGEANLLVAWGDSAANTEAVALLAQAIATSPEPRYQAQMLELCGTLLGKLQRFDEARRCFAQQQALCIQKNLWFERYAGLSAAASFEYFYGEKARVEALLDEYQQLTRQQQDPWQERLALQKRLDFAGYQHDWPQVAALCTEALALCLAQGWHSELPYLQKRHAAALQKLGHRAEAAIACRTAIAALEQQRHTYAGLDDAARIFRRENREPYERLLTLEPPLEEAYRCIQQLKAQGLREQTGQEGRAIGPEEKALKAACERLSAALVAESIRNEVGGKKRFAALQAELALAERALARYYDTLHAQQPVLALRHAAPLPDRRVVQKQLAPDTALVEFVVPTTPEFPLFALVLRQSQSALIPLTADITQLQTQVATLRKACERPGGKWEDAATALYTRLMAPLESALSGCKSLVVCPDGLLWEVPFGLLRRTDGKLLLERFSLTHAFSAALWHAQQMLPAPPPRSTAFLAVAAPALPGLGRPIIAPERPIIAPERPIIAPERPIIAPERGLFLPPGTTLPPLPGALKEVRSLVRLFPGSRLLEGEAAQESRVKTELSRCHRLHIAAHAFLNTTSPYLSCLVLADPSDPSRDDGFLTARELLGLDLSGIDLATLSACGTARGQALNGEGVRGLGWALTAAGARSLVLSQWNISDTVTVGWMTAFYTALKRGQSKSAALRDAALTTRKIPGQEHPYYWAPFLLIGRSL